MRKSHTALPIQALPAIALMCLSSNTLAHEEFAAINANSHAPIGVMGDHLHKAGEWMVSYRYMQMSMADNLLGGDRISPETIVSQIDNPTGMPPTLRVVPLEMTTDMHMVGIMYAPSDSVTLMAMFNYLEKSMDHITFQGMMGTERLGRFNTRASGMGDTSITALINLYDGSQHKVHAHAGISLPTGDIDQTATVLTPMNTQANLRMPYAMQLGSGTYDLLPGVTYRGFHDQLGWGGQLSAVIRTGDNDEGYTLGDKYSLTGWASYQLVPAISASIRAVFVDEDSIDGRDPLIAAPVQTANPNNYGGERLDFILGINYVGQTGSLRGHRVALEYHNTVDQKVNAVQMEMQDMITLGYQLAF